MTDPDPLIELLGDSAAFVHVKVRARQILSAARAGGRLPAVLIQGETGTGKGLFARTLHRASPRAAGPFVGVNCGAVPETLGESEFFGFARGAHSEARQPKIGLFQAADHGTIFLDEVGLLSSGHQARLLKVVEDRQVIPVGSTRPVPVDLWVICATNADLEADVQEHRFRRDLYERLAVITFALPPLRERLADVVPLAERFLTRSCAEYGLRPKQLAADAKQRLVEHPWLGNVRELSNVMERVALLVEADIIPAARLELGSPALAVLALSPAAPVVSIDDRRARIVGALQQQGGNLTRAAATLRVTRKTLREWMRQHGLYPYPGAQDAGVSARRVALPAREPAAESASVRAAEDVGPALGVGHDAAPRVPASQEPAWPALGGTADIQWEQRWITLLRVNVSVEGGAAAHETTSALTLAADKVHAFGGSVIELGRTGLDAAFGFDALEGAAERAAYAVLAIQRARARDLEPSRRAPVARLALHTDSYLVGRIGASNQIDQDAKQTASTVLAKLIAVAEPDTAVVSGTALRFLRRRFDCAGPLPSAEEPRSETPSAYRLLGRMDVFDKAVTPFVGRDNEMTLLASRWSLAREGMGQVVGIVGEPGVGKSRLVWEFIHGGHDLGGLVLETASVALGRPTPYLAIIDLLRAYFRVESGDGDDAIREKVARHLEDLDPALVNLLPAFLSLLDVTTEDSAWAALDPTRRRQRTVDAIRRLMLRASARQPLLLLFEDAHWADSETRALLDTIADSLRAARVLILVTFRPEYEHGWGQRSFYTQIRVDPLRGDGVEQFLGDLLGRHPSMDSVRARLVEWTGGTPFFLEETVRTFSELDVLAGERGAYRLNRPLGSLAVPDTVQEVLAARMARLASPAYELLQSAAALGRRVAHPVLAAVAAGSGEALSEGLQVLKTREFLYDTGLADEAEYSFEHALTQEVAYATLPEGRRRTLHARIAVAMERVYAGRLDERIAELAHHSFEGERWKEAVEYLHRAGARAIARSANTEAAACFEHALTALAHLPESRENQETAVDLRFGLRNALTPLGQVHRTLEHLREAERLASRLGDERRRGRALSFAANCLCITAEYEQAVEAATQARRHARSLGDFPLNVSAGMYLGRAAVGLGQYRRAADVLQEVAESLVGNRATDYLGLPVLPAVFARSQLVLALAELGEFGRAERLIAEAIEIADSTRHPETLLWAYVGAGSARLVRGDLPSATAALEHALEVYGVADIPVYFPLINSPLGLAYAMAGRVQEGRRLVEAAVERTESRRQTALLAWTVLRLGEVRGMGDDAAGAGEAAARALDLFREHQERGGEAYALRLLGDVEAWRGDAERARLRVGESYDLAERLEMKPLAARCRLWLATARPPDREPGVDTSARLAAVRDLEAMGMDHWARPAGAGPW